MMASPSSARYTVFISHAGEDKATIANPLREKLRSHGITAFVDEEDMPAGTEAQDAMATAMETAEIAVVVLSPEFVARKWPMKELMCFLGRKKETAEGPRCRPVIIPFFYQLNVAELYDEPRLDRMDKDGNPLYHESRFFERMKNKEPEANIAAIKAALTKIHAIMGVRNDVAASNDSSHIMNRRRETLLEELCNNVKQVAMREPVTRARNEKEEWPKAEMFRPYYDADGDSSKLVLNFFEEGSLYADTPEGQLLRLVHSTAPNENKILSLYGIAGVGKTSVLRGLLELKRVKQRFRDGVYFISLGMGSMERNLEDALSRTVEKSGGLKVAEKMRSERRNVIETFRTWFADKQCLFIVDDVWETKEISATIIRELLSLHESGKDSKVLLTTRSVDIASRAGVTFLLEPREALDASACEILVRYAGVQPKMDCLSDKKVIEEILEKCCGLPLFLAIAGKAVRTISFRKGCGGNAAYHIYARSLAAHMGGLMDTDIDSYRRLKMTLSLSIELLENRKQALDFEVPLSCAEMHRRLCLLEKQEKVPMSMLRHLWELKREDEAAIMAREFEQIGLADIEVEEDESRYKEVLRLHDSLHLFASREAKRHCEDTVGIEALLRGYGDRLETAQGCLAWWSVNLESDGYIHGHVCQHLRATGRRAELLCLLLTPQWTVRQLELNGIVKLESDFSIGISVAQGGASDGVNLEYRETEKTLELISGAARLSWTFVSRNHKEICFQLHGRLIRLSKNSRGIREYLNRMEDNAERPWLQSRNSILTEPGGVNTMVISLGVQFLCMALLNCEDRIACGCPDGRIIVVNLMRGEVENHWQAHHSAISRLAIGRNGTRLVSASEDGTAKVWDTHSLRCVATFEGHTDVLYCVAVMSDGKRVVTGSWDGTAQVWDIDTGRTVSEAFKSHKGRVLCVAVLGDGEHVVTGGTDNVLRLWNATSGTQLGKPFVGHGSKVLCVAVLPDGRRIVSGSRDETVRVWDVQSRKQVKESLQGHTNWIRCVAVSGDGGRIISGSNDTSIRVWAANDGHEVCSPLQGHELRVKGVSFRHGRDTVVSCSHNGSVRLWDLRRKNVMKDANRHEKAVLSLTFTPDGKRVVSGSADNTLRIWDVASGQCLCDPLQGHALGVTGVVVTPSGQKIVSVSWDMTVRIWDLESHELLQHILRPYRLDHLYCSHTEWRPHRDRLSRQNCPIVGSDGNER